MVDRLIEQVGEYMSNKSGGSTGRINLSNVPADSFSGTYNDIRQRLHDIDNPNSSSSNNEKGMEVDDMYHVLSMAFLLMEDEREEFRQELKEVEGYFEEKVRETRRRSELEGKNDYRL